MRTRTLLAWLFAALFVALAGACAKGAKPFEEGSGGTGNDGNDDNTGGVQTYPAGTGGSTGGGTGGSGGGGVVTTAGVGGTLSGGSGGTLVAGAGGTVGDGGTAGEVTADPPVGSLGIHHTLSNSADNTWSMELDLENDSSVDVDLTTVTIRIWFSLDELSFGSLVFEDYYMSHNAAPTSSFEAVDTGDPTADSYLEIGFTSGSLPAGEKMDLNIAIHDEDWVTMNKDNDYSFTTATGYTEQITVYVNGDLVWGVEPGGSSGTGGAGGEGGATGGG